MEFRTTIRPGENNQMLAHSDALMLLGSCFSDNIGARLRDALMDVDVNPFGTIYNPLSLDAAITRLVTGEPVAGIELFQHNGVWNSYDFHSRYSMADKQATLDRMNRRIAASHDHLLRCRMVVVTLGTAIVYRRRDTDRVVSNCHKVPQHEFSRRMATVPEIVEALDHIVAQIGSVNSEARIVFTISPIRHIADGLDVNSLSKATLRVAVDDVVSRHRDVADYFPAYEIMIDDLRDYRFYAADMLHPSDVAVEYIWQMFQATYCDDRATQAIARCERVSKRLQHRPMSANRQVVERFQADTEMVVRNLVKEYPYLQPIVDRIIAGGQRHNQH